MKTQFNILLLALLLLSCQQASNSEVNKIKKGMIKVAILYPNAEGKTFDMDYYASKHMRLAASLFGDSLVTMEIDKGLANGRPGEPIPYLAIGYFYFENLSSMKNSMGPNGDKLRADFPNYTNIQPIIQVSEVIQ